MSSKYLPSSYFEDYNGGAKTTMLKTTVIQQHRSSKIRKVTVGDSELPTSPTAKLDVNKLTLMGE